MKGKKAGKTKLPNWRHCSRVMKQVNKKPWSRRGERYAGLTAMDKREILPRKRIVRKLG